MFTTQKKELEGLKKSQISSSEAARVPMEKNELSIESGKDKPVTPKTPLSGKYTVWMSQMIFFSCTLPCGVLF